MKSFVTAIILLLGLFPTLAQEKLPVLKSDKGRISIKDGETLKKNGWRLAPEINPDIYEAELIYGKTHRVTFFSDIDSISFIVEERKKYDFIIEYDGKKHYTQIVGKKFIPRARFDEEYRRTHKGKTFIEIPEVYELVNVAFAIKPLREGERSLIARDSDYYRAVMNYFGKHKNHPFVEALDKELQNDRFRYFSLKTNAYAFEFDKNNKIVKGKIYDRIQDRENALDQYIKLMQSFADDTNFREFYRRHQKIYSEQIRFFREKLNIDEMLRWLSKHFPESDEYDSYKIIFSPLVRGNQSVNWFESNGFKELQPHVEFPYRNFEGISPEANLIYRGEILFTEMNHGFLNPLALRYLEQIKKATSNRYYWVAKDKGPRYYSGTTNLFDEYMNWILVNLRHVDYVEDREEQEKLIARVDRMMVENRGFPQFAEFSEFLVDLYRKRKPGQIITDLYPQIIAWFDVRNQKSLAYEILPTRYDQHRFIVEPVLQNGKKIAFYTDTGGGLFIFKDVAEEIGLINTDSPKDAPVSLPEFQKDFSIPKPLSSDGKIFVIEKRKDDSESTKYITRFAGMLGQAWFSNRVWIFDYPKQMLLLKDKSDIAESDPHAVKLGFKTNAEGKRLISFPRIQVEVDGEKLDLLFDTGAMTFLTNEAVSKIGEEQSPGRATSFITNSVFETWRKDNPDWRVIENAEADSGEAMIEVPKLKIGGYEVGPIWFTRRKDANFHEYMTQFMDKKIEGAIGGNALKFFKVAVDYPRAVAFFEKD